MLAFFLAGSMLFGGGVFSAGTVQAEEAEELSEELPEELGDLHAQSAVLMDGDSGRVLVAKDGDTMRPMASTTKIMTCILTLEQANLEDTVTASANAAAQPRVHLGMQEGEQFVLRDLLYSLMLESHNDSAVAIAEHVAGSVEAFAGRMNEKAREIGCEDAHFVTPNGLDAQDGEGAHSISAANLARILTYCISRSPQAEQFLEITRTADYSFSSLNQGRSFFCQNQNAFLGMMEGALTGKTGFTGDAGYCYAGALRRDGRTFVVALLACGWPGNSGYKWEDTRALMEYGLAHYTLRNVWQEPEAAPALVENGIARAGSFNPLFEPARVNLVLDRTSWKPEASWETSWGDGTGNGEGPEAEKGEFSLLLGDDEEVRVETETEAVLEAPVAQGKAAGEVRYYLEGELLGTFEVVTGASVEEKRPGWMFGQILQMWLRSEIEVVLEE